MPPSLYCEVILVHVKQILSKKSRFRPPDTLANVFKTKRAIFFKKKNQAGSQNSRTCNHRICPWELEIQ